MKILKMIARISVMLMFAYLGVLLGCSSTNIQDKDLKPYVDSFTKDMDMEKEHVDKFSYKFLSLGDISSDKGSRVIGRCNVLIKEIDIDPKFWYEGFTMDETKKALMYHELGHCACKLLHANETKKDGCPASIMNSTIPSAFCLQFHWKDYMDDLYERCE